MAIDKLIDEVKDLRIEVGELRNTQRILRERFDGLEQNSANVMSTIDGLRTQISMISKHLTELVTKMDVTITGQRVINQGFEDRLASLEGKKAEGEARTVKVMYRLPVEVEVDLDSERVVTVTELTDQIQLESYGDGADRSKAIMIAENVDWPIWDRD